MALDENSKEILSQSWEKICEQIEIMLRTRNPHISLKEMIELSNSITNISGFLASLEVFKNTGEKEEGEK